MRGAAGLLLLFASLALPAGASQLRRSFQVGAAVVRSAGVRMEGARLRLTGRGAVVVAIDGAPPQLVARDVALPAKTIRVTVQY